MSARALGHLHALDGKPEPVLPASIDTPFGPLTLEQAAAIDLGRMHVADDEPAAAAALLEGLDHPSARNNLAIARFMSGDVAGAQAAIDANWRHTPDNLFALERALRWRCWADGLEPCKAYVPQLLQTAPRRVEDALSRVAALRFLDDAQALRTAWDDSSGAPYWDRASAEQRALFDALGNDSAESIADDAMWFPRRWMHGLRALKGDTSQQQARWEALLDGCDAHADYLARAAELGGDVPRLFAMATLKRRAGNGDAAARAGLQALLKRRCGPDSVRMDLLRWLTEQGFERRGADVDVHLNGAVRRIRSLEFDVHGRPRPSPYPPEAKALAGRMHRHIADADLQSARVIAEQLVARYPQEPSGYANLAAIKEGLDEPHDEIAALYARANALAPEYLFGICGHARCLAREGQLDAARALLMGLSTRTDWHYTEYRSYLLSQRELALASGELEAAAALEQALVELEQNFSR